jgi:hypothetical protein
MDSGHFLELKLLYFLSYILLHKLELLLLNVHWDWLIRGALAACFTLFCWVLSTVLTGQPINLLSNFLGGKQGILSWMGFVYRKCAWTMQSGCRVWRVPRSLSLPNLRTFPVTFKFVARLSNSFIISIFLYYWTYSHLEYEFINWCWSLDNQQSINIITVNPV